MSLLGGTMSRFFVLGLLPLVFLCLSANGAEPLSFKINPNGRDAFGVVYAYDRDFAWQITYTTTLRSEAIASFPSEWAWRLVDAKTHEGVSGWEKIEKERLLVGQIKVTKEQVLWPLITRQGDLEIDFGFQQNGEYTTKYFLPLGALCRRDNSSDYFKNLTEDGTQKRCFQITERDLKDHLEAMP
jgi:hypothetical protein